MACQLRSLSLPQLRDLRRHKGNCSQTSPEDHALPSVPSTPSTSASSRVTPSSVGWKRECLYERPSSSSTYSRTSSSGFHSSYLLGNVTSTVDTRTFTRRIVAPSNAQNSARRSPATHRPDEELLQSVRTEVMFGGDYSVENIYDLIQEGEDVNQRSERGFTPLAMSVAAGSLHIVALLLEKRADATITSVDRSELPLHYAACQGDRLICQLLLSHVDAQQTLEATSAVGWSPLHLAVVAGHEYVAQSLLRAGSSPDTPNTVDGNHTSMHLASMSGHANVLELLLDYDGDANIADSLGRAPLHFAAKRADAPCVAILLRHRADPLQRGGVGNKTPMELVPRSAGIDSDRTRKLFSAYVRQAPPPRRTDTRFDLPGGHDILSAYNREIPGGLSSVASMRRASSSTQIIEVQAEDEVWL